MNKERSNQRTREWKESTPKLARKAFTAQRIFRTTPEKLFPLLCPTTELDWLPGWDATLLHTASGVSEYNAIFSTSFFGTEELWVCTRFEPGKAMEYSAVSGHVASKMDIALTDNCDGTTTGRWLITISALTEAGNAAVGQVDKAKQYLEEKALDSLVHYIDTGEMKGS